MTTTYEEQGTVEVGGEPVRYAMRIVDARTAQQRERDALRGGPAGYIMAVIPGHGQGIYGPKRLVAAAAQLSSSKIAWCIDPVPARGGDHVEGQAIARIVREKASATFPAMTPPVPATLIGWSHGASEALRAAGYAPDLFPQFLGLCPLGTVERRRSELLLSFASEAARILWTSARQRNWPCLRATLRLGANAGMGLVRDLLLTRSPSRLVEDISWAAKRVSGSAFQYPGDVVLLYGRQDTVVRWQDAFPKCARPEQIASSLAAYGQEAFPRARRVEVQVIEGAHVAPEADPPAFLRTGLGLLGQLDAGAAGQYQK